MTRFWLAAGVAALAVSAPAVAQKGDKGGGGNRAPKGQQMKAERGQGGGGKAQAQRAERGPAVRAPKQRAQRTQPARAERAVRNVRAERADRAAPKQARRNVPKAIGKARGNDKAERDRKVVRQQFRDERGRDRDFVSNRIANGEFSRGMAEGCPPGLAMKGNGCMPPGQARKLVGRALPAAFAASLVPTYYRNWYPDTDDYYYRQGDGLMYRIARSTGLVDGSMPLFGYGDYVPDYYGVGEAYPLDYVSFYNVPAAYQSYYPDQDDWLYRYGDGGIYRVEPSTGLVDSIVQLLAGDMAVGQPLPVGYDVYNVPYAYRDRYYDTPDNWYRYNDGYIYQVDPKTRLIQAVIEALV